VTKLGILLRLRDEQAKPHCGGPGARRPLRRRDRKKSGPDAGLALSPAVILAVLSLCLHAGPALAGEGGDESVRVEAVSVEPMNAEPMNAEPMNVGPVNAEPMNVEPASMEPMSVLELFTSQGCSSCPAADRLLERLAKRKDVVALSLPVAYWDYLGWKDTLAQPGYYARQRRYSEEWGQQVYTPELVVNGLVGVVGSNRAQIEKAISASRRAIGESRVPVRVRSQGDALVVNVGAASGGSTYRSGSVWVAWLTRRMAVDVKKGENKGRRLSYFNVVRELKRISAWTGVANSFKFSKKPVIERGYDSCAVLVQSGESGPILGAAQAMVKPGRSAGRD
jgi:hypothetical protein